VLPAARGSRGSSGENPQRTNQARRALGCAGAGSGATLFAGKGSSVNDQQLHQHIETLVAEEHALFEQGTALTADDRRRLDDVNVQLDRLWDLLRQRRAREEFGQNPDRTHERPADTVEKYLQ
jgi:hypothetical protein